MTTKTTLQEVSFNKLRKVHSQNYDEDLILTEILRKLNITHGKSIELMGGNGIECNTSRLALDRWNCLIFDGNERLVKQGQEFWSEFPPENRPTLVNAWVTRENIADLIEKHFPKCFNKDNTNGIDVFSLDMDGMDFWVLKALYDRGLRPKVFILEIQEMWTDQQCLTLEYQPNFHTNRPEESGCSLPAFLKLLGEEYKLVACISKGFNVFLVRKDLDQRQDLDQYQNIFQEMDQKECFKHHHGHFENIMKWRRQNVEQGKGVGKWIDPFA